MKPPVFAYRDPRSLEEALTLLEEHGLEASLLAGGQSLVPLLNLRLARPEVVIDLNHVTGLADIVLSADALTVGALTRVRSLEREPQIKQQAPAVHQAVRCIAHPQIRSRTTVGGNIAHADPSSELPGVLAACDGRVELTSKRGSRWVSWEDFFVTVFTTSREPGELVTKIEFPLGSEWTYSFREVSRRSGDYPMAGVCIGLSHAEGVISQARVAAIAVADRPVRLKPVETALKGAQIANDKTRQEIAAVARDCVPAMDDNHGSARYRKGLIGSLVSDILADCAVSA